MTRITEVEVQNIMKIRYAALQPQAGVTVVGGKNRQGKSSLLSAIAFALGGKRLCPARPLKDGEASGVVKVHLEGDDSILLPPSTVVRTFTRRPDGEIKSELEILSDDGFAAPEPQTLLNRLLTSFTFDPLAFTRLKPSDQAQQLRELAGIDDSDLQRQRAADYNSRTFVGREVKQAAGQLAGLPPRFTQAPDDPVTNASILAEMRAAQEENARHDMARRELQATEASIASIQGKVADLRKQVQHLVEQIENHGRELRMRMIELNDKQRRVDEMADIDLSAFQAQLDELDAVNAKVRSNQQRAEVEQRLGHLNARYQGLTDSIAQIDAAIAQMYTDAAWPISGLGFADDGVTYQGMPFDQCSSAEQLRVSVAIGFALNPALKVLLVRDGSLLDEESLAQVQQLAEASGGQVFLERVGEGSECHLVLRDGSVVGQEPAQVQEPYRAEPKPSYSKRRTTPADVHHGTPIVRF